MKPKISRLIVMVLLPFFIGTSCQKDNEPVEFNNSLNEVSGIIGFDELNQQYFIIIYIGETIDGIITAYPDELLPEQFRTINLNVIVSGELYKNINLPEPVLGGQKIFGIKIQTIHLIDTNF